MGGSCVGKTTVSRRLAETLGVPHIELDALHHDSGWQEAPAEVLQSRASAALDAVFPSSETGAIFPELLAEGLKPHKVKQVFIAGALDPDVFVDISRTLGAKVRALKAHRSQVGKGEWVEQLLTAWALRDGKRGGLRHAEAFKRMVLG